MKSIIPQTGEFIGSLDARILPSWPVTNALLGLVSPLLPESMNMFDALGCVQAKPVIVASAIPRWPISMRDGYALSSVASNALNTRKSYILSDGRLAQPGDASRMSLPKGAAIRILTGAPLPKGADTVVRQEDCEKITDAAGIQSIQINVPVSTGQYITAKGSEFRQGEVVLAEGALLGPEETAVLSLLGHERAMAHPRPKVAIIVTGSELAVPGSAKNSGKIPASNAPLIANMVRAMGCDVFSLVVVSDDVAALEAAFLNAMAADFILTSGGTGPGPKDIVGMAASRYEVTSLWHERIEGSRAARFRILSAQKVAGQKGAGQKGGREIPHLGLPGRPIAAIVSFCLFAYPILQRLSGRSQTTPHFCLAHLEGWEDVANAPRFLPVRLSRTHENIVAHPILENVSCGFTADGYVLLRGTDAYGQEGHMVPVLLPPWRVGNSAFIDFKNSKFL